MAVYVDDMFKYAMGRFGRMKMSHMIADTEEELHKMADTIKMNRKWYQGDHYDISITMRDKAIAAGAVPITMRILSVMALHRRMNPGPLLTPEQAQEKYEIRKKGKQLDLGI